MVCLERGAHWSVDDPFLGNPGTVIPAVGCTLSAGIASNMIMQPCPQPAHPLAGCPVWQGLFKDHILYRVYPPACGRCIGLTPLHRVTQPGSARPMHSIVGQRIAMIIEGGYPDKPWWLNKGYPSEQAHLCELAFTPLSSIFRLAVRVMLDGLTRVTGPCRQVTYYSCRWQFWNGWTTERPMVEVYDRVIRVTPEMAAVQRGHGDACKKPNRNAAVAAWEAVYEDFFLKRSNRAAVFFSPLGLNL